MTLHQAIESVLEDAGRPLTADQIASAINRRKLYARADGQPLRVSQIRARVDQYQSVFKKVDSKISLEKYSDRPKRILQSVLDVLRQFLPSHNQGLIVMYLLFYVKISGSNRSKQFFGEFRYSPSYKELKNSLIASLNGLKNNEQITLGLEEVKISLKKIKENALEEIAYRLNELGNDDVKTFINLLVEGQVGEVFSTPYPLAGYISKLVKLKSYETLYDPFAGTGTLVNEIISRNSLGSYHLKDIESTQVLWGTLSLTLQNPLTEFFYENGDSLDVNNRGYSLFQEYRSSSNGKYNWVVLHPPFGMRLPGVEQRNFIFIKPGYRSESAHIQLALHHLTDDGKAIIIVPEGLLFASDKSTTELKQYLIENDWIESVHSIPPGTFLPHSNIKTSILVINKNKSLDQKGRVFFKEISKEELSGEKITVRNEVGATVEEIQQADYLLTTNRYVYGKKFQNFEADFFPIKEFVERHRRGMLVKRDLLGSRGIPVVTIKHLSNSLANFKLSLDDVDTFIPSKQVEARHLLSKGTILIATIGTKLKATLFDSDEQVTFQSNVVAINLKNDLISNEYFIHQLNQPEFIDQLEMIKGGSAAPFISVESFLRLSIRVPSKEKQAEELIKQLSLFSNSQEGFDTEAERRLLTILKHEFGNLKVPLVNFKNQFKRFIQTETPVTHPIRSSIEAFEISLGNMTTLFTSVDKLLSIDAKIDKTSVDLINLTKTILSQFQDELTGVSVYIETDANYEIMVDANVITLAIQNFLLNSQKHGFTGKKLDKNILFNIYKSTEDETKVWIDMLNDGHPLPEEFSFEELTAFGLKAGANKGSGIGGYLMKRAVEVNGGRLTMPSWPGSIVIKSKSISIKPSVGFRIELPYNVSDEL